jgi:hypothetical protein
MTVFLALHENRLQSQPVNDRFTGESVADVPLDEQNSITLSSPGTVQCSSDLDFCSESLETCKYSVESLKDIALNHCEKPLHDFETAAWSIARSHEYSDQFNCENFSSILNSKIAEMGYSSRIARGSYKGEPHTWVVLEIPIESTSGNLITPEQYKNYEEK